MLCAIAPGSVMFEETLNTLKYSNRAKEIKVQAEENKKVVELHIAEFKGIFEDLWRERTELFDMAEASKGDATEDLANLEKSADLNIKTDNEQRIRQLSEQINALLGTIEENLPSPDARRVVGEVVQLKAIEIENMELEINLKFYEQLNRLMMVECKALQQSLVEAGIEPEEEGLDQVQEEDEQADIEETNREIDELKKKMQESGIEFEEFDPNQLADEQQSNYDGIDLQAESKSEDLDADMPHPSDETPDRLLRAKAPLQDPEREKPPGRFVDSEDEVEIESPPHGDRDTELGQHNRLESRDPSTGHPGYLGLRFPEQSDADYRASEAQPPSVRASAQGRVVAHDDMMNEMNLLNTVDKSKLNFDNQAADPNHQRFSTIRGEKKREQVHWNLTIGWGEEFRLFDGEFFPETTACFEAEIPIGDRDFVELLDEKELRLLELFELGE